VYVNVIGGLDIEPSPQKPLEPAFDANRSGSTPGSERRSAFVPVGSHSHSLRRHVRRGRKYVTGPASHGPVQRGPLISEPGPVDFSQYGMVARMWMEQVTLLDIVYAAPAAAEALISTRILGPDPTNFEAYRAHPIDGPDQVLLRCWRRPYKAMETPAYWTRMSCFT